MTYKQKHLALLMSAAAILTLTGCKKQPQQEDRRDKVGLLDDTPLETGDKYSTRVTLYHVDVPLYDAKGNRRKDTYMLTRALSNEDFTSYKSENRMSLQQAYFNDSPEPVYVKADENMAVETTQGYVGLFLVNKKAVIVAESNISRYLSDFKRSDEPQYTPSKNSSVTNKNDAVIIPSTDESASLETDSLEFISDTISWADSLKVAKQYEQPSDSSQIQSLDTLKNAKFQREP